MKEFFGGLLMAVGGLIAVLSGMCSLAMFASGLRRGLSGLADSLSSLPLILLFGGVPFALGAGLFMLGRRLRQKKAQL